VVTVRWPFRRRVVRYVGMLDWLAITASSDWRGIPTAVCPCGCDLLLVPVVFDAREREISGYVNTAFCTSCSSMLTVPTLDPAEVERFADGHSF